MQIERIAVIGAGTAGRAFALACVRAGFAVTLEDVMPEKLRRAEDAYAPLVSVGGVGSLRFATTVEDAVADADMAIDFVPDELESKLEIFCLLDRMAPPRTIIASPTHALSIGDLASCTYRAERCVAVRGASLVAGDVAVVRGAAALAEVAEAVAAVWVRLGCTVTVVGEV
jgi:3-hydroxybutyryl-CoA dehydrogenase